MRINNAIPTMKITRNHDGSYHIENRPVKMIFVRSCGTEVDWSEKENPCTCVKCMTVQDREEVLRRIRGE